MLNDAHIPLDRDDRLPVAFRRKTAIFRAWDSGGLGWKNSATFSTHFYEPSPATRPSITSCPSSVGLMRRYLPVFISVPLKVCSSKEIEIEQPSHRQELKARKSQLVGQSQAREASNWCPELGQLPARSHLQGCENHLHILTSHQSIAQSCLSL